MGGMQIIAVQAAHGKISIASAQMMAAGLQKFAFLVVAFQIVGVVNLGLALRYGWWSAFFGILQCVPCVSLIALLVLNSKATRLLQESGLRVGLMGAKQADLDRYPPTSVPCPSCGEELETGQSTCPLCGHTLPTVTLSAS